MAFGKIYEVLNAPLIYRTAQFILGPGAEKRLLRQMEVVMQSHPAGRHILDIGCGPQSWLFHFGLKPVGLDLQPSYIDAYRAAGAEGIVGSAEKLPFPDNSFDSVWSIGLFHHVPDDITRRAIEEAIRVCKTDGNVVIFDAVYPAPMWRRPLAALIRKLDRGQHVRTQEAFTSILPGSGWSVSRFTHTYTGLELLQLVLHKG